MTRPYTNRNADVTAGFPASVLSVAEKPNRDLDTGDSIVDEAVTVPGSADYESNYRIQLNQRPKIGTLTITRTSDDTDLTIVPWSTATGDIGDDEVAVDWETGFLAFPASAATEAHTATYTGQGGVVAHYDWTLLAKEVAAVQQFVKNRKTVWRRVQYVGSASLTTDRWFAAIEFNGEEGYLQYVKLLQFIIYAAPIYQRGNGGATEIIVSTDSADKTQGVIGSGSIGASANRAVVAVNSDEIDTSGGTILYLYLGDSPGGHSNLEVDLEFEQTQ